MIFSKFFKAKWQHKDSNVRITAINEDLSAENTEDLTVLLQLISDDNNELVRRSALLKVNTFEQWLAASRSNTNNKVKEYAAKQIISMLHGEHAITLTVAQKQSFLEQDNPTAFLEAWFSKETDAELIISLYKKINKPQLMISLFSRKFAQNNEEKIQRFLVEQTADLLLLEKLLKKTNNQAIKDMISAKIAEIIEKNEKPIRLTKQVQLLLSKLLALKELTDYGVFQSKQALLVNEWNSVTADFVCLSENERHVFNEKYQSINEQLVKTFAPKEEAYIQAQIAQQLVDDKKKAKNTFDQALQAISQALTTCVFENTPLDEVQYKQQLLTLKGDVSQSVLNDKEQSYYYQLITTQTERLSQLPEIAESVSEATHLISRISQLAVPKSLDELNERSSLYNDWLKDWQAIENKTKGILPQYIKTAYQDIVSTWRKGLKPLQQEQKALFNHAQKKLSELKRLLSTGKYNASFGVFKRVEKGFLQLSTNQQQKLQRDFDSVSEQIKELSDLEHFIATPRKQQLLDDIKTLIASPLDNPHDQAGKVKQFRQAWNLLGHADEDLDKSLNNDFNAACEQAFAPCRLFFGEQEKMREHHLQHRLSLIEQAKDHALVLNDSPVDYKTLDGHVNKLTKAWQESGEVDRTKFRELQNQFNHALQPIKTAIRDFHQQNIVLKTALIEKATLAAQIDDLYQAVEDIKDIQTKWREIGYAGPRQENKLWQTFRTINDQLFKKRDALKEDVKQQQSAQQQAFEQQLLSLQAEVDSVENLHDLKTLLQQSNDLLQQVVTVKPVIKSVANAVESFIEQLHSRKKQFNDDKKKQTWLSIFSLLTAIAQQEDSRESIKQNDSFIALPEGWQKKILGTFLQDKKADRSAKSLALEVLAGVNSPSEFSQQRMQIQIQLMQDKMSSGQQVTLEQYFDEWLGAGPIGKDDLPLIIRIKAIFCT